MHKGSCLCGAIRYEVSSRIDTLLLCHCQRCRKANGSAFAANAPVPTTAFRIVTGEEQVKGFRTEAGVERLFCSQCASPLISKRDSMPDIVRLRVGTLDTPLDITPTAHIFTASKVEWLCIDDAIPQYAERPPT
ncbi:GFA family protein [Pseudomonas sp. GD03944]|uniref:GFA family protein n=1 Tax=Pseudomonas sp. GD03944 TaxID=2975409 RepID=UPI002446E80C|nr:GFA family protein [Pseudomonas sp. GD03944]MDH1265413.1 GFA family protein [Pseudomonas sp. GD03944]